MYFVTVNDQSIHYIHNDIDSPQPAIILVHGAGSRSQSWPNQWQKAFGVRSQTVRRWVTDYPVYIIDLPGHGKSEGAGCDTVDAYAEVVIGFADALGLSHYVVAGHSMGAAIALTIGLIRPKSLTGLITFGGGADMPVNDMILSGLKSDFKKTVGMITKFSWQREATPAFVVTGRQHMLTTDPDVVHGDFLACSRFDVNDRLGEIDVPLLAVAGSADKMMAPSYSEKLVEKMPNAQIALIDDAGHFMQFEKTAKTTKAVVKFMSALEKTL